MLLWLIATGVAAGAGYFWTRSFVRDRLRFVDAVQKPIAPVVAGVAAALVAAVPVALLPIVGAGTALVFGASVAAGVASGRKDHPALNP